ncbi:hypothetical protein HZZ00_37940 (plasmid) [Streptomyces sp. NEAU-sy36]|uniref:hypothetical protein n=1 Tax=unclassified Streptomyces TaxID=2593676 RepID=UPI0015D573B9|nr:MULTISPECIES: hypothetical protein [unclassified Streptomyces]QLJ06813.1 hypothetical protein HZZ00_37940 [Streptomyces sp. NEAU-sy36]
MTTYRVRPNPHSAAYLWRWECLHTRQVGADPRPVRCQARGLAVSEADAETQAADHAATH